MQNLIPHFIQEQYKKNNFHGNFKAASMFVDISGFTTLTETLMQHEKEGAEVLTNAINSIFNPIVHYIYEHGGMISIFAGDAFTALFPINQKDAHLHLTQSAFFVNNFFGEQKVLKTKFGDFEMGVKVGLSYGEVDWGILGKDNKFTYFFRGSAVDGCAKSEHYAKKGDIIADEQILNLIQKHVRTDLVQGKWNRLISCQLDLPPKNPPPKIIERDFLKLFTPKEVIEQRVKAEFRNVCSVFISFDEPENFKILNKFISFVLTTADSFQAYFNKIDFGDKGGVILIGIGAPVAFENNAERALDFVLTLKNFQTDIAWRTGLTYGTVYAGIMGGKERCEYTIIGDIVNLSARFMMKANWNEYWVAKRIYNYSYQDYRFNFLGEFLFKGKSGKIPVYKLLSKKVKQGISFEGKFVGRSGEMKQTEALFRKLRKNKSAGFLYIYGEAGVGKSRFLWELQNTHSAYTWAFLPTEKILKPAFYPFRHFFNGFFEQSPEHTEEVNKINFERFYDQLLDKVENTATLDAEGKAKSEEIVATLKELQRMRSVMAGFLNLKYKNSLYSQLDAKGRYENILFVFKEVFKALSLIKPIVLQFEDLQWMDAESKDAIRTLCRRVENFPILVIFTSRHLDDGSKPKIKAEVDSKVLDLNTLSEQGTKEIATEILENDISDEFLEHLLTRTDGNPFFIEQTSAYYKESGLIQLHKNKWEIVAEISQLPHSINDLLIARVDRLSAELKEAVQTASVLGREFLISLLAGVLKKLGYTKSSESYLKSGEQNNVWSLLDEMKGIFAHAMMQDAVYGMQLMVRLRRIHKTVAEFMEAEFGDDPHFYGDLALHYGKAEITEKAIEYLEKAGDFAKANYENMKALGFYQTLLKQDIDIELRIDSLLKKVGILELTGKWTEAEKVGWEAIELAKKINDDKRIARSYGLLGWQNYLKGSYDKAMEYYEKPLKIYENLGDKKGISATLGNMGSIYRNQGNYSKAMKYYKEYLKISQELGDKKGISSAVGNIGIVYSIKREYGKAMENYNKQLDICEKIGDNKGIASAIANIGVVHMYHGDFTEAMKCFEKNLTISKRLGDKSEISKVLGNIGNIYRNQGNYSKAMEYFEEYLKICEELGNKIGISSAVCNIGIVYDDLGQYSRAMEFYKRDLEICKELGDKSRISLALGNIGEAYFAKKDYSRALEFFDRSLKMDEEINFKPHLPNVLFNRASCLYEMEEYTEAKECNDKCFLTAKDVNDQNIIFSSLVLKEKIIFQLSVKDEEKLHNIEKLQTLLKEEKKVNNIALLNYELAIMNYALRRKGEMLKHKEKAESIYKKLDKQTPNIGFKNKVEEMEQKFELLK